MLRRLLGKAHRVVERRVIFVLCGASGPWMRYSCMFPIGMEHKKNDPCSQRALPRLFVRHRARQATINLPLTGTG